MVKRNIDVLAIAELIDYPGQFAGTTITDWNTGKPNPRYQGMKLLRDNFSSGDKLVESGPQNAGLCTQGFITSKGKHKVLLINKRNNQQQVKITGCSGSAMSYVDLSTGAGPAAMRILKLM